MGTPRSITQLEQLACQRDRLFEVHNERPPAIRTQPQPPHALALHVMHLLLRSLSHRAKHYRARHPRNERRRAVCSAPVGSVSEGTGRSGRRANPVAALDRLLEELMEPVGRAGGVDQPPQSVKQTAKCSSMTVCVASCVRQERRSNCRDCGCNECNGGRRGNTRRVAAS